MNQIVYLEGSTQEYIYIVVKGDFNLLKTYKNKKLSISEDDLVRSLLSPSKLISQNK